MVSLIQSNLVCLKACVPGYGDISAGNSQEALTLTNDICKYAVENLASKDLDYACSLLFSEEVGFVFFLKKCATYDEFYDSKIKCLEFFIAFLESVSHCMQPYASSLKDVGMSLFLRDRKAPIKSLALSLIIKVLELYEGNRALVDMDVQTLTEKLFLELSRPSKLSATVKATMYHLLGVLAERFPEYMMKYSDKLLRGFLSELKQQMTSKTKTPEFPVVAGCLHGLSGFLHSFTHGYDEDPETARQIFDYIVKALAHRDVKRYEMLRAALTLLAKHLQQFAPLVYEKHRFIYENLRYWTRHKNPDLNKHALAALESFFHQIAENLVEKSNKIDESSAEIFQYYIKQFHEIIAGASKSYEINVAIKGYGSFAAPCKRFMSSNDVKYMLNEMIQRHEQIYLSNSEMMENKIQNLPSFIESLSSVVAEVEDVDDGLLRFLENLVVVLIENFPLLALSHRFLCYRAVMKLLFALYSKGPPFKPFLNKIVYQGILRTCSHPVASEAEVAESLSSIKEKDPRKITYKDYLELWRNILKGTKLKVLNVMNIQLADRETVCELIFDEVIKSILTILQKLDLTTIKAENEEQVSGLLDSEGDQPCFDPVHGLQPVNTKDFQIIINLVDLARDLLPFNHLKLFRKWVYQFGSEMIMLCTKHPVVSGFYKMLAICLEICRKLKYFKKTTDVSSNHESEDKLLGQQRCTCFTLFTKFVKEILVRIHQFKDDLLVSCLQVLLFLPEELVETNLPLLIPAVQLAFKMGLSYLPLATWTLDALELWCRQLPPEIIDPHLPKILPCLNEYIKSATTPDSNEPSNVTIKSKKTTKGKSKLVSKRRTRETADDKKPLANIQLRIVLFLGSLGSQLNSNVIGASTDEIAKLAVAWDSKKHLMFPMPFVDMKPVIYLDEFLPRVTELATISSDRHVKIAACELLHSLVLFMLGTGAQRPDSMQKKYPMDKLYKRIFPVLLVLACDSDQVTKQLFEPLTLEIIHWFTNSRMYESAETKVLLDSLMDGLVHPTDTRLRDISAKCLKEFVIWSVKQTTPKEQSSSPINMKALLKRMYSLCMHPNAFRRLGAAYIFNSIYMVFREEEELVKIFILEILYYFINSLAIAHNDEKSFGTQVQAKLALDHVERILTRNASSLNKNQKTLRLPKGFKEGTLEFTVEWLLEQCGRPQTECRHKCMELVCKLAPYVDGVSSAAAYFERLLTQRGSRYFVERFEKGSYSGNETPNLHKTPVPPNVTDSLSNLQTWLNCFLAPLDCYTWLFGGKYLAPHQIFTAESDSCFFKSILGFMKNVVISDVMDDGRVFSPKEINTFNQCKCTVIVRLMYVFQILFNYYSQETIKIVPESVWNSGLWDLISSVVVQPADVGFDMGDEQVMTKLRKEMKETLSILKIKLPKNLRDEFDQVLSRQIVAANSAVLLHPSFSLDKDNVTLLEMPRFVWAVEQLNLIGFDVKKWILKGENSPSDLGLHFFSIVFESVVAKSEDKLLVTPINPSLQEFGNKLLNLAFSFGVHDSFFVKSILDSTPVSSSSGQLNTTKGALFLNVFTAPLSMHVAANANSIIEMIVEGGSSSCCVDNTLIILLDEIWKNRAWRKQHGKQLLTSLLEIWPKLTSCCRKFGLQDEFSSVLAILAKMLMVDSTVVCDVANSSFLLLFQNYLDMIVDSKASFTFKSRVMDLIPFFTGLSDDCTQQLQNRLRTMADQTFPLDSHELTIGSVKYNEYVSIFNKLLKGLEVSGSVMLLEFIISIVCRESEHICEETIQKSLSKFIKCVSPKKQIEAVEAAYNVFKKTGDFTDDIRRATLNRVGLTLLSNVGIITFKDFFAAHIMDLMDTVQMKDVRGSEDKLKTQLISKIGCFELLELMYNRLAKDDVYSKGSLINERFCGGKSESGKELTQALTRICHFSKKENVKGESVLVELRRQFHCRAYNTLIAVICCTQNELKFYTTFLFTENIIKGDFLWENIVDVNARMQFDVELETAFQRKRQFVALRHEVQGKLREEMNANGDDSDLPESIHYLTTQYLAGSSLSEEVSQFDFSVSLQALKDVSSDETLTWKRSDKSGVSETFVELEMDVVNLHECMGPLSALLEHMANMKLTPVLKEGETNSNVGEMPSWMTQLHKKMTDSTTAGNVNIFIAKIIINNARIFEPFAKFWFVPLMQLVVSEAAGGTINFFTTDVLIVMLSWASIAIPADNIVERSLASRVLEFTMSNAAHPRRDVLRNNFEIIKTIVELWKSRLDIPMNVIYDNLKDTNAINTKNSVGIQLLGIVLANGLAPYTETSSLSREKFFKALALNLTFKYSEVYAASAEVIGMAMKYMAEQENIKDGSFHTLVEKHIRDLSVKQTDHFITALYKVQLHYPPFAARFVHKIFFILPRMQGSFQTMCLEIVESQIESIENVFVEMKNNNILKLLSHRQENMQVVALKVVDKMLKLVKGEDLLYLLPTLNQVVTQPSAACRKHVYHILMWIYDNYRDETMDPGKQVKTLAKDGLLRGLADVDEGLKLRVNNYWSHETRLSTKTLDRSVSILENLYSPSIEEHFLGYASFLLLEMTSKSPDYHRKIFNNPLSECHFVDYNVNYAWNNRFSAMTPMFTERSFSQSVGRSLIGGGDGELRATQDVFQYTPTQDQGSGAFNWLTQTSVNTFAASGSLEGPVTQSAMMFTIGPPKRARFDPVGANFGRELLQPTPETSRNESLVSGSNKSEVYRLRRRFLKDRSGANSFFAARESRKERRREDLLALQKQQRQAQVTMYRKYRKGDLPDIEINHSALIAPLQALAQKDDIIAKLLCTSLFQGIWKEGATNQEQLHSQLSTCFHQILQESDKYHPALVNFILEISFHIGSICLDYDDIASVCVNTSLQNLGILLLENSIVRQNELMEDPQPSRKKARTESSVLEDVKPWLKLVELYKSVDDYDSVRGIFNMKFGSRDITRKALDAESRGDFHTSVKFYEKALHDEQADESELDFWEDSYLQCNNWLCNWDKLSEFIDNTVTSPETVNLMEVWDDTYHQEHYLPYLMRAKLKLLIEKRGNQPLLTFVDGTITDAKNPNRRLFLESRYSEELAMLYTIQEDFDRARHYLNQCLDGFLQNWASSSELNMNRAMRLQSLQKLSEMHSFLEIFKEAGNFTEPYKIRKLMSEWEKHQPNPFDSVTILDDIVSNRSFFMEQLSQKLSDDPQNATLKLLFKEADCRNRLSYISGVAKQNNFLVALKVLKTLHSRKRTPESQDLLLQRDHAYADVHLKKLNFHPLLDRVKLVLKTWSELEKIGKSEALKNLKSRVNHQALLARAAQHFTECLQEKGEIVDELDEKYRKMIELFLKKTIDPSRIAADFRSVSLDHLNEVVNYATELTSSYIVDGTSIAAQAHLSLAVFCDKQMQKVEGVDSSYSKIITESLLDAIKLGSRDGVQLFPRLLDIVEKYPDVMSLFQQKAKEVPAWMFIGWVNQMLAILDKDEGPAVHEILMNIADLYPQALVYPFKLSNEGYSFATTRSTNHKFVKKLELVLARVPHVSDFIFSLEQLSDPETLFKDFYMRIDKILKPSKKKKTGNMGAAIEELKLMDQELFTPDDRWGKYRKEFATRYGPVFHDTIKKNATKLCAEEFKKAYLKVSQKIDESKKERKKRLVLSDYASWFANFHMINTNSELEIPGQYTGKQKPTPELHVKIVGFDEQVMTLSSIRRPRQITIRGHDERDYKFLVKGGEDLRLDQRIEQLFGSMNEAFVKDPACGSRRLQLITYQVIPLTNRVGLLEWVENTCPLKVFLDSAMDDGERKAYWDKENGLAAAYLKWTLKYGSGTPGSVYAGIFLNCSMSDAVFNYRQLVKKIPQNLLRRAFLNMSSSLEAFFTLRNRFATSHAVVCICHYLLGIGDRHLSNLMVNLDNGAMMGIDFGHAFGTATQFLPVPELMPFRFTPQFVSLMEPLGEGGIVKATMVHVMSVLRENCEKFINLMNIFIKEPSHDWKELAKKQKGDSSDSDDLDFSWYPKEKIMFACRKLNGDNPAWITRDELKLGHSRNPAIDKFCSVSLGSKERNFRARMAGSGLSVEEQVNCLIDQATDENILGRTYFGWEPWM